MIIPKKIVTLILTISFSQIVFAACEHGNIYEDIECYDKQIKQDKAKMNSIYNSLSKTLDDNGKKELENSQKAWLSYRDAQCNGLMGYFGSQAQGAGSALIQKSCVGEKLEQRIKELNDLK